MRTRLVPFWSRNPRLARFADDRSGTVAVVSAICAVLVLAIAGAAVDYSRWLHGRSMMQAAVDAAVLAGGRELQVSGSDEARAINSALTTYRAMRIKYVQDETIAFNVANRGLNMQARGNAYVSTPFMGLLGTSQLPIFAEGENVRAEAAWTAGSNSDTSIEMALMLDTTGSMAGSKIHDLRDAAAEMVDIVVWPDQSQATSRMAIVPFSSAVNVGDLITQVIDPSLLTPRSQAAAAKCVVERLGSAEASDTAPDNGAWMSSYNVVVGSGTSNCPEDVEILPLSSDRSRLKSTIAALKAQNSTAGALGTAWAWYMLSPAWSAIWPAGSTPASYSATVPNGANPPRVAKIAVLMTDGAYNTFLTVQNADQSRAAEEISAKAVALCGGMKQKGIVVYTVGFALDSDLARSTLRDCATSPSNFYDAADGDALRIAFRDIAIKSSPLRLSH